MDVLANPYARALLLSSLISVAIAAYAWRRREAAGAVPVTVFMLAAAEWSLAYALELGSTALASKVFWAKAQYFGIVIVAPAMLVMVIQYIGRANWLTRRNLSLLAIVPLLTLILVWTNGAHGLIWTDMAPPADGPSSALSLQHGAGFWVIVIYSYACLLLGTVLLARRYRRSPSLYRAQTGILLLATLIPWVANFMYISGITPFPHLDLTPFAFALTGLVAVWGLFQVRLLNIVPIARYAVIEDMSDGVIVLDSQARIVDINPSARELLIPSDVDPIGQPIEQVLTQQGDLLAHLGDGKETRAEIALGQRYYTLAVSVQHNQRGETASRVLTLHETTEIKETELAVRDSQQRLEEQNLELRKLSLAVEQSANMVIITDTKGLIEYVNPKFEEITGYTTAEAVGQNPSILKSGQAQDEFYAGMWKALNSGKEWRGEFHNKRKDGSFYWEQATIAPIYDTAGQISHYIAIKEDITARKQAEDALTRLLELSRVLTATRDMDLALTQAVQSAIVIIPAADRGTLQWLDHDGKTLRTVAESSANANERDVRPFQVGEGVAGHALASKQTINVPDVSVDDRYVPGEPGEAYSSLLVAPLVVKDRALGTLSLSSVQADAFSATDETLAGLMADQMAAVLDNAQEFAARQQAEEALQGQRERITTQHEIVQSILAARLPETIAVAAIGRIRKLIPCQRALVMAVDESGETRLLASESGPDAGHMPDQSAYQEMLKAPTLNSGRVHGAEDLHSLSKRTAIQQALYKGGLRSYVVVPLFIQGELVGTLNIESGKPGAFTPNHITIATEVAGSLALAIRQARLYERAQLEIAERMQAQEVLRQYTVELEARNSELDAFAHTVAHDLKSPVSTIVGYSDMLTQKYESLAPDTVQEFLHTVARSSFRMSTIIDELLLLASVRGMQEVKLHTLDMSWIVTEVLDRLRYRIEESEAEIILPGDWPSAMGYSPWVEEVWVNYVSNALKYGSTPPRVELGAEICNSALEGEKSDTGPIGEQICFWVRDNGDGLTPEEQERLFTPFERLHQVRVAGHGLGLSIVQRIVQKLGGRVGVKSKGLPGQGCEFYFTLPAVPPE